MYKKSKNCEINDEKLCIFHFLTKMPDYCLKLIFVRWNFFSERGKYIYNSLKVKMRKITVPRMEQEMGPPVWYAFHKDSKDLITDSFLQKRVNKYPPAPHSKKDTKAHHGLTTYYYSIMLMFNCKCHWKFIVTVS